MFKSIKRYRIAAIGVAVCGSAFAGDQPAKPVSKIEVEVIYVKNDGCYPSQITRPQGQQFRLWINNQSTSRNLPLTIQAVGAASPQASKQLTDYDAHWLQLLTLPAGTYMLTSSANANLSCTLVLK